MTGKDKPCLTDSSKKAGSARLEFDWRRPEQVGEPGSLACSGRPSRASRPGRLKQTCAGATPAGAGAAE